MTSCMGHPPRMDVPPFPRDGPTPRNALVPASRGRQLMRLSRARPLIGCWATTPGASPTWQRRGCPGRSQHSEISQWFCLNLPSLGSPKQPPARRCFAMAAIHEIRDWRMPFRASLNADSSTLTGRGTDYRVFNNTLLRRAEAVLWYNCKQLEHYKSSCTSI